MYLVKLNNGHFAPYDSEDHEQSSKIGVGEVVKASKARNYEFHKKAFALLNLGHQNQEQYEQFNVYRKIIIMRAGYYTDVKDAKGRTYFIPHSLSFESMSAETFEKCYNDMLNVISEDLGTDTDTINQEIESFF